MEKITRTDIVPLMEATLGISLEALTGFITAIKTVTRDIRSKVGRTLTFEIQRANNDKNCQIIL